MILPNKYITLGQSYLGISAMILSVIGSEHITVENIWGKFKKKYLIVDKRFYNPSYQKFLLTLDFMYLTNMLNYNEKGEVYNENLKS